MPASLLRLTLRKMILLVAVLAIPFGWMGVLICDHRERCLEIAGRLAGMERAYRAHGPAWPTSKRMADWNAHLRRAFERAASRPWEPIPRASPTPPGGFVSEVSAEGASPGS